MTTVRIEENPEGTTPLAKARGAVEGWTTMLAEHEEAAERARAKRDKAVAAVAAAEDAIVETDAAVVMAETELESARANLAELEGTQDGVE